MKAAIYPNKVRRHWDNPQQVDFLGFVPINWIVLVILLGDEIDQAAYSVLTVRGCCPIVGCRMVASDLPMSVPVEISFTSPPRRRDHFAVAVVRRWTAACCCRRHRWPVVHELPVSDVAGVVQPQSNAVC